MVHYFNSVIFTLDTRDPNEQGHIEYIFELVHNTALHIALQSEIRDVIIQKIDEIAEELVQTENLTVAEWLLWFRSPQPFSCNQNESTYHWPSMKPVCTQDVCIRLQNILKKTILSLQTYPACPLIKWIARCCVCEVCRFCEHEDEIHKNVDDTKPTSKKRKLEKPKTVIDFDWIIDEILILSKEGCALYCGIFCDMAKTATIGLTEFLFDRVILSLETKLLVNFGLEVIK